MNPIYNDHRMRSSDGGATLHHKMYLNELTEVNQ